MAVETGDSNESTIDERGNDKVEEKTSASIPGLTGMSGTAGTFGFRAFRPQHCGPRDLFTADMIGCLVRIEW